MENRSRHAAPLDMAECSPFGPGPTMFQKGTSWSPEPCCPRWPVFFYYREGPGASHSSGFRMTTRWRPKLEDWVEAGGREEGIPAPKWPQGFRIWPCCPPSWDTCWHLSFFKLLESKDPGPKSRSGIASSVTPGLLLGRGSFLLGFPLLSSVSLKPQLAPCAHSTERISLGNRSSA